MTLRCKKGDWVQIHNVILKSGERSPDVPEDTQRVPLEAWVNGWAQNEAEIGQEVQIKTLSGRTVVGTLFEINPGYTHSFGPKVPEIASIGQELRAFLKGETSDGQ